MKAPMKSYEMTKWPCLHLMKKNTVVMRKKNTENTYESLSSNLWTYTHRPVGKCLSYMIKVVATSLNDRKVEGRRMLATCWRQA